MEGKCLGARFPVIYFHIVLDLVPMGNIVFFGMGMLISEELFFHVTWHGYIDISSFIVPFDGNAAVEFPFFID